MKPHLHIVCHIDPGYSTLYLVPLNTLRDDSDRTVILDVGDHPFVNRSTVVSYHRARKVPTHEFHQLEQNLTASWNPSAVFTRHAPVSDDLYRRILRGAIESDATPMFLVVAATEILGR